MTWNSIPKPAPTKIADGRLKSAVVVPVVESGADQNTKKISNPSQAPVMAPLRATLP
jgi:hypothetical protein